MGHRHKMLKNCPWCHTPPTTINYEELKMFHIKCLNDDCKTRPISTLFASRNNCIEAWNNPIGKSKSYSENQLKKIFSDEMVDEGIWKIFFPDSPLWET